VANPVQLTPEQTAALKAFQAKYPDFDYGEGFAGIKKNPAAAQDFLALWHTLGLNDGEANSRAHFTPGGTGVEKDRALWKQFVMMAATVAAPGIAYAAMPAAATAGATPFGATGPGIVAGPGIGGVEGAAGLGGGTAATAGGTGLFSKLAGPLIAGGTQIGSAAIQAKSNSDAAKLESEAAEKALALQRQMYEERRADEAGYRRIGNGALGLLGQGMGIDMTPQPAAPAPATAPQTSGGPMGALGPPASPQAPQVAFTSMRAPNGMVLQIPNDKVQQARSYGAQVVS
jgi:hypothetical protein